MGWVGAGVVHSRRGGLPGQTPGKTGGAGAWWWCWWRTLMAEAEVSEEEEVACHDVTLTRNACVERKPRDAHAR